MSLDRASQLEAVQKEGLELFKQKNKDYGDSFSTYGPIGVIVRLQDKINRLVSITTNGINIVKTESLRDTLIDLHNYTAMAIMLIDEKNPPKEKSQIKENTIKSEIKTEILKTTPTKSESMDALAEGGFYGC